MKLKVIAAFNDLSIEDPDKRRREIGEEFETGDARAEQLVELKLVELVAEPALPAPVDPAPVVAPAPAAAPIPAAGPLPLTADMAVPDAAARPAA